MEVHAKKKPPPPILSFDKAAEAAAASDPIKQKQFLSLMGLISPILIEGSDVLTLENATTIALANAHNEYPDLRDHGINDGYYTVPGLNAALHKLNGQMCNCPAHTFISTLEPTVSATCAIGQLIRIPSGLAVPMNNNDGKLCSINTINQIFFLTNLPQYICIVTEQGTPYAVSYMLIDPGTSSRCSFAGWPDFIVGKGNVGAEIILLCVGEVQSERSLTAAQLGIYAIGQFQNMKKTAIACVAVYKNKSASIYLASLTKDETGHNVGTVTFQPVNTMQSYNLMSPEEVQLFAKVLIGTLQYTESC